MKIFFNSSMPRSGSTLMQNILGNNPSFYATPTSGLLDMINASKKVYSVAPAFKAQDSFEMKKAFLTYCRYALQGYFEGITDKPYVIDKSRGWAKSRRFLDSFYPNPKIICMVRDLRDIVASMEKNFRKHPDIWDKSLENNDKPLFLSVSERVTTWMHPKGGRPVGTTLVQLREVIHQKQDKYIHFVKLEDLLEKPDEIMKGVYDYLEVPYFQHDFNNIEQVTHEDDKFHGIYGDHKIKPKIEPIESNAEEILGKNIYNQLLEKNKWYFDYFKY
jgi:sulfotransferase